jgi:hypothetical protein
MGSQTASDQGAEGAAISWWLLALAGGKAMQRLAEAARLLKEATERADRLEAELRDYQEQMASRMKSPP